MRILIVCGGTGGHIFPAISLARELKRRGYTEIIFAVDENTWARGIIREAGFDLRTLRVPKMPYGFSIRWPSFLARAFWARQRAKTLIAELNPDIAIGFGAYISGPVISAASSRHKKILIHEQNAVLGRANRMLLSKADKVCFSFDNKWLTRGSKYILTGNPIRQSLLEDFQALTKEKALSGLGLSPHRRTLLVLGGSRGASAINRLMADLARRLEEQDKARLQIVHISGEKDLEFISGTYQNCKIAHWVKDFYERMGLLYKAADLAVCRSGAATVAELCLFKIPAVLIPYPGAGFHQKENARVVAEAGGAIILEETKTSADNLKEQILALSSDQARLREMAEAVSPLARPDATLRLADSVEELAAVSGKV